MVELFSGCHLVFMTSLSLWAIQYFCGVAHWYCVHHTFYAETYLNLQLSVFMSCPQPHEYKMPGFFKVKFQFSQVKFLQSFYMLKMSTCNVWNGKLHRKPWWPVRWEYKVHNVTKFKAFSRVCCKLSKFQAFSRPWKKLQNPRLFPNFQVLWEPDDACLN